MSILLDALKNAALEKKKRDSLGEQDDSQLDSFIDQQENITLSKKNQNEYLKFQFIHPDDLVISIPMNYLISNKVVEFKLESTSLVNDVNEKETNVIEHEEQKSEELLLNEEFAQFLEEDHAQEEMQAQQKIQQDSVGEFESDIEDEAEEFLGKKHHAIGEEYEFSESDFSSKTNEDQQLVQEQSETVETQIESVELRDTRQEPEIIEEVREEVKEDVKENEKRKIIENSEMSFIKIKEQRELKIKNKKIKAIAIYSLIILILIAVAGFQLLGGKLPFLSFNEGLNTNINNQPVNSIIEPVLPSNTSENKPESKILSQEGEFESVSIIQSPKEIIESTKPVASVISNVPEVKELSKTVESSSVNAPVKTTVVKPVINIQVQENIKELSSYEQNINSAFEFYNQGLLESASQYYLAALELEPTSKDALLGLGSIAIVNNQPLQAISYYQTILDVNPNNLDAITGMLSAATGRDKDSQVLAKINYLLQNNGNSAHLFYVKAMVQAGQQNWVNAQQNFFNAWQLSPNTSIYTFNLAVSLDHLGQSKQALNFYQATINNPDKSYHQINEQALINRINQLEGRHE